MYDCYKSFKKDRVKLKTKHMLVSWGPQPAKADWCWCTNSRQSVREIAENFELNIGSVETIVTDNLKFN